MTSKFTIHGEDFWYEKSDYDFQKRYYDFREYCAFAWIQNGKPKIEFSSDGKNCVFPDGFTINIDTFDKNEAT